ncbi:DUF3413 domain-containing protein [Aestuariibacter sp. GS-14]|uniref:DUF3413 domain-containing protein n=1 Tax=Aestuariibacter sp. GS-14 TaxID=2590670 RepID=UPI00112D7A35|nr:DUF3413 domain-containing protein [Aestuariibacter sp. GS-14]TPV61099.1 DUF3413 domain-containing protein [Aestuariibacter sp. GS-14]
MILAESPRRQRVTKLVNWGHWFALANIVIAIIIASVYVVSSPAPGTGLGTFYLFANWFGHIGFLTFFGFVIFILPLCYLDVSQRTIKTIASAVSALGLAVLAFDALLFNRTGFHLTHSSANLIKSEAASEFLTINWQQWLYLLLLFVIWLGFQLMLANAVWKRIDRLMTHRIARPVVSFFVVCFVSGHAIHVWADAQLYQPIIKQDNMFPLSYPATAKTTMSRYGLLDIERYQQRKQLQFEPDIHTIAYPSAPVYCAIDESQSALLLVQTDQANIQTAVKNADLREIEQFFTLASSPEGLISSTLFGVPELYQQSLLQESPIILALAKAYGVSAQVYVEDIRFRKKQFPAVEFATSLENSAALTIAFVSGETITSLLAQQDLSRSLVMVATGYGAPTGSLFTNLPVTANLASNEDLTPTLLNALGCAADVSFYSTGQNLLAPKRDWLVSTSGEKVVVIYGDQRIEVLSNGSYDITQISNNMRSDQALNVDLLSRAIKHLTRFMQ